MDEDAEIIIIVCGSVLAVFVVCFAIWCYKKRCNRATTENDFPQARSHDNGNYDVEAQRGAFNVNNFGHQTIRSSRADSSYPRQQGLPQYSRPHINVSSSGNRLVWPGDRNYNLFDVEAQRRTLNVDHFGPQTNRGSLVFSSNIRQQSFRQHNSPQLSVSSSRTGLLKNELLPSDRNSQVYNTEPQRETNNINRIGHRTATHSGVHSSDQRQQGLPQQITPKLSESSSGTKHPVNVVPSYQPQNSINSNPKITQYAKLDLHQFTLKEAMTFFKMFLDESINNYNNNGNRRQDRFIEVITGRGKHSPEGIPVIKPAVENYLITHQYKFAWANPGMVRIDFMPSTSSA